ncbi:MAG: hypothetical protein U9R72_05525 [Chloroflexota bacterium]|nr:hypothetical protein [Chloroflexota bacterium]
MVDAEFVIRAQHNRRVELYDDRLDRWEEELLDDLAAAVYLPLTLRVTFTHARETRVVAMKLGWLKIRLPDTKQVLWLRRLGGKLGLPSDRDGSYVLLAVIRAVFVTIATLTFASEHAFPR